MKDTRKPYHLAANHHYYGVTFYTLCKRYVTRNRLIGPHMDDDARFCHDCRKELKRRFGIDITSDVS